MMMVVEIKAGKWVRFLDRTGFIIETGTGFICVLTLAFMVIVVATGVLFRYVFNNPVQWGEELARFLMLWTGFIAMNIAMRRNQHVQIDIVVKRFPVWIQVILAYCIYFLVGYFLVILTTKGYGMAVSTRMTAASLPVSMSWIYASVPVGALLTMIQLTINFLKRVTADAGALKQSF